MINILSFDIEEWFHPENLEGIFHPDEWDNLECRVIRNTEIILSFLQRKKLTATFFILGWVAEKYPDLVTWIVQEGHEVASHGYSHKMITKMNPQDFEVDLKRSLEILNSLSHDPVIGFRAPTFSITKNTLWALPILHRAGIRYDSSVFPIFHDRYGIPDAPRHPYVIFQENGTSLVEFPMSTINIGNFNFPLGGGGYFRLYPLWLSIALMKKRQSEGLPIIFYAHPWEFDTELPELPLNFLGKIRHYTGIKKFLDRLDKITDLFPFTSFKNSGLLEHLIKDHSQIKN